MSTEEFNKNEKIDYARKILKQYKSNAFLADLGINPSLQTDGIISNINEFIEIKNNTTSPLSCETPLEKIALIAPKAVSSILEGIHNMKAPYEEKKNLFDLYIDQIESTQEASKEALIAFAEAYDDSYMGIRISQSATEI